MSTTAPEDQVFKALAHPLRRSILDELKAAPKTTGMLCETFSEADRCTVMQHLRVLEQADLIIIQREGRERWNHLNSVPIKRILDRWIGDYATHAVAMLDRLKFDMELPAASGKRERAGQKQVRPKKRRSGD